MNLVLNYRPTQHASVETKWRSNYKRYQMLPVKNLDATFLFEQTNAIISPNF